MWHNLSAKKSLCLHPAVVQHRRRNTYPPQQKEKKRHPKHIREAASRVQTAPLASEFTVPKSCSIRTCLSDAAWMQLYYGEVSKTSCAAPSHGDSYEATKRKATPDDPPQLQR
eukprot:3389957-Amphidinium_carterae.1